MTLGNFLQWDAARWQQVPDVKALQTFICDATTGSALVMVLEEGADFVHQLSSQSLALACQRLAHFEIQTLRAPTQGLGPVTQMLQVSWPRHWSEICCLILHKECLQGFLT